MAWGRVVCCTPAGRSPEPGWGNVVIIRHGETVSWYAHLDRITVREGQEVGKGARIGSVGSSGSAGEPELAFRIFRGERPVDPLDYLP